jgi:NDP-sugar pyrophosphorylase family protein
MRLWPKSGSRSMLRLPDAIVLCGGAGLRLKSITGNAPKSMAGVAGRPFLEVLLRQLERRGFKRVILAVGYQQEAIRGYFGERAFGVDVCYSPEQAPLGTGGAIRHALDLVESGEVLVMNGDSYTDADLGCLMAEHRASDACVSVVVVPADRRADIGSVRLNGQGRVAQFDEKTGPAGPNYINAGIYVLSREIVERIPPGVSVSIERELFPRWLAEGVDVKAFVHRGVCVDIGTPERYQAAQALLAQVETDAGMRDMREKVDQACR